MRRWRRLPGCAGTCRWRSRCSPASCGTRPGPARLLHEAGETHHRVFRIVDGADDDWATWYADWLASLSELPDLLGVRPVRSELTYLLVSLDKQHTARQPAGPWESDYAQRILDHFHAPEA
jgi:hypothetical protein